MATATETIPLHERCVVVRRGSKCAPKPVKVSKPIFAIDFGTGDAFRIWGPDGEIKKKSLNLPRVQGGRTKRDEFIMPLEVLLKQGDVVVESPTVGSSGAERMDVLSIVNRSPNTLYTITARAVKNYRLDNEMPWRKGARYAPDGSTPPKMKIEIFEQPDVHVEDAEIIYKIATETPWRLRVWHLAEPLQRVHTSVRPMDKRDYRDTRSDEFMALLPTFSALPDDIKAVLGTQKGEYSRAKAMPFAMALTEPFLNDGPPEERRKRFQKILGAYDAGYPSFYRRAVVVWMHENARVLAGVTRVSEVTPEIRKRAWKLTQHQIRHLFHLATVHNGG